MLSKKEFINWFKNNGVDFNVTIPFPLITRLINKARAKDLALFIIMKDVFIASNNKNYLILKYKNWDEIYNFYLGTGSYSSIQA